MRAVTGLIAANRRASRTRVELDGEPWAELDSEVVLRHALRKGATLDDAQLEALRRDDAFVRARRAAAILLHARPRSAAELRGRLAERGFDEVTLDRTIDYFAEKGDLDDARFARAFVAQQLRTKKAGPIKIANALRRLGVEEEHIATALEANPDADEEQQRRMARRFIERRLERLRGEDPVRRRRKLRAALARAGFRPDAYYPELDDALRHVESREPLDEES